MGSLAMIMHFDFYTDMFMFSFAAEMQFMELSLLV